MKKKILLVGLMLLMLFTGCSKTEKFNEVYKNMKIDKDKINGYEVNIKLNGTYNGKRIKQDIEITNSLNEDYKVVVDEETFYLINGKKYKKVNKTNDRKLANIREDKYEEIKTTIPFLDTEIYIDSLKKAQADDKALIDTINDREYKIYTYRVDKKFANKLLKDTELENLKFKDYVPAKIWIDSNKYVYKIIYDLGASLKQEESLTMTVIYTKINEIKKIELNILEINNEED